MRLITAAKPAAISICTVCMGRLYDLKKTLPVNLANCSDHPGIEFVLLDYNSNDGLGEWVAASLAEYIAAEKLIYYKITDPVPDFFSHAHSKNVVFRLAAGEILCSVNADHYVEEGFPEYVAKAMGSGEELALISNIHHGNKDNFGRICIRKSSFLKVRGFDEQFKGYGYEDTDMSLRLTMAGVKLRYLSGEYASRFITHPDDKRIENTFDYNHVQKIFFRSLDPDTREVVFLYADQHAEAGTFRRSAHDVPLLGEEGWQLGEWQEHPPGTLTIALAGAPGVRYRVFEENHSRGIASAAGVFYEVREEAQRKKLLLKKSLVYNYHLLNGKRTAGVYTANPGGFPVTRVLKNFSQEIVLGRA